MTATSSTRSAGPISAPATTTRRSRSWSARSLLKPDDPTINDHLGDAYWRVGRTLEAHFQWAQAKDFKPEPDELANIEKKLKDGLPVDTSPSANVTKAKKAGNGG